MLDEALISRRHEWPHAGRANPRAPDDLYGGTPSSWARFHGQPELAERLRVVDSQVLHKRLQRIGTLVSQPAEPVTSSR